MCSYFNTSSLYEFLFETISSDDMQQEVFIPMYKKQELIQQYGTVRRYQKDKEGIKYYYLKILHPIMRFMLHFRALFITRYIKKKYAIQKYDVIHAHSLLFNGSVARNLSKKYNKPYIVAVRNTDLEVLSKLPIYKKTARKIMKDASEIIFISESLKDKFQRQVFMWDATIERKISVIPNGISDEWYIEDIQHHQFTKEKIKFVYQGTLLERKRVEYVLSIIKKLNEDGYNCEYKIYGEGPCKNLIKNRIKEYGLDQKVQIYPWTNDYAQIKKNYCEADIFIMPSYDETFGISYIESLACGTPVIYTKGDGIDGMLQKNQGKSLFGNDLMHDCMIVKEMIENYDQYYNCTRNKKFTWKAIGNQYIEIYKSVNNNEYR